MPRVRDGAQPGAGQGPHYKWIALSNTTLGVLMATINASIVLIALPDVFRGIGINPLRPGNTGLLLWLIMGYMVVTAVLVVSFGRLGDIGARRAAHLDWAGNLTFAVGLVALLTGITYGIQPYGGHTMGWTSPFVLTAMIGGTALLVAFCFIELRVEHPMFQLPLFRIRAFTAGNVAALLSSLGRGGLMFILIIWLQGIYLPRHGYSFSSTPLWAGIFMLPLTAGFLIAGPVSGWLSDRYGARAFATGGMLVAAGSFGLLEALPVNFVYWQFALILLLNGIGMGLFASPNRAGIMNAVPPERRGIASGMSAIFQNSSMVLSIGVFFTLIILGLAASLPGILRAGLVANGVPAAEAARVAGLPPVAVLFAALLGYNPVGTLLGPVVAKLPAHQAAVLTGHSFFPSLIAPAFSQGLALAFDFAITSCLIARRWRRCCAASATSMRKALAWRQAPGGPMPRRARLPRRVADQVGRKVSAVCWRFRVMLFDQFRQFIYVGMGQDIMS